MAKRATARKSTRQGFRLNAPKRPIFLISLALAIVAIVIEVVRLPIPHAFWIAFIGYLLLALGVAMKGF
jgi:hypothetical protein